MCWFGACVVRPSWLNPVTGHQMDVSADPYGESGSLSVIFIVNEGHKNSDIEALEGCLWIKT